MLCMVKAKPTSDVDWLTPTPDGTPVEIPWPEESGPFVLTCHLALVDGRAELVGLDVRSFTLSASGAPASGPSGLAEVNHPVLRSLRAGEIAEAARLRLAAELASQARSRRGSAEQRDEAKRRYTALTSPAPARPSGYRPASEQLEKVAALFHEALAAGGDAAKAPSLYVHLSLSAEGSDITLNAVRGQIHRARQKGLVPKIRG